MAGRFGDRLLHVSESPFILGLLLAFIAWGVTHIIDRTLESPILEYSVSSKSQKTEELIKCESEKMEQVVAPHVSYYTIRNLSRDSLFTNVSLALRIPSDSKAKFIGIRIKASAPAIAGSHSGECGTDYVSFKTITFHPRWKFVLVVATSEKVTPHVYLSKSDKAILLQKGNIETFLIRNETEFIIGAIIIVTFLCIFYMFYLAKPHFNRLERDEQGKEGQE